MQGRCNSGHTFLHEATAMAGTEMGRRVCDLLLRYVSAAYSDAQPPSTSTHRLYADSEGRPASHTSATSALQVSTVQASTKAGTSTFLRSLAVSASGRSPVFNAISTGNFDVAVRLLERVLEDEAVVRQYNSSSKFAEHTYRSSELGSDLEKSTGNFR